jgi:translation initiation factor IF-2
MGRRQRSDDRRSPRPAAQKPGGKSRGAPRREQAGEQAPTRGTAQPARPEKAPGPLPPRVIELPDTLTVRDLAKALRMSPIDVIKELMANGIVASINQTIDYDTAEIVARELGFETRPVQIEAVSKTAEDDRFRTMWQRLVQTESPDRLQPRPPVVTVLGHVDHGKTTLLDAIRQTNVVGGEYGGITQHIGAYQVEHDGRKITFLDTPGHEAFTAMRARGAMVTDLAVLVVAADDGVMPQTREAIAHARAAGVPILVALNKMDKPSAQPDRVKQQLADMELTVEEWGGDVIAVPVSAKMQQGISELLENILLLTEVAVDLRSNPDRPAVGTVVEAQLDTKRGPTATLLVQGGTLHVGDALVIGPISGRVRAMMDHLGNMVKEAPPAMPVLVMGLSDVPRAGEHFEVLESEREARARAEVQAERERLAEVRPTRPRTMTLDEVLRRFGEGEPVELNLILKADVDGSLEPIVNSIEPLGTEDQEVHILHQGIGNVSESDVMLASASDAIIIGFHVDVDEAARRLAAQEGVDIRQYNIIYNLVDDVDKALKGMLEPVYEKVVIGHAQVRAVFDIRRRGNVAGCLITDGEARRNSWARVLRQGEEIFDGQLESLKRFQEDVSEVRAGFECGIGIAGFEDFQEGDVLEFYREERVS